MKKLLFILTLISFAATLCLTAQNRPYGTGLIIDDEAYNQVPHLPQYAGKKYNKVPLKVSLRNYCPTPGNQGLNGSCSAWAAGYGGLTILRAIQDNLQGQENITNVASSVFFLFNQIKLSDDCEEGSRLSDAMKVLKSQGDCLAKNFDSEADCSLMPGPNQLQEASQYKIKDYAAIFHHDADAATKIKKTKIALASKTPVVMGMLVTESFWGIEPGQKQWNPTSEDNVVGGHAMVVVGYDEVRKSFEVMNSWGPDWADNGFVWIKYTDFAKYCKYGFQMVIDENTTIVKEEVVPKNLTNKEVTLSGAFSFRYPTGYEEDDNGNEVIAFEDAAISFNETNQVYETIRKDWAIGDVFQLVATEIPAGENIYIFSVSPSNKVELHWPLNEGVDALNKVPLADFVPSQDAEIIVPGENEALQLAELGTDHLVILYSDQKIANITTRVDFLSALDGAVGDRLKQTFGDILLAPQHIKYELDRMKFNSSATEQNGFVVPIILSVTAK